MTPDPKYRVQHAAGILDGLRTVAVLVAEDLDSQPGGVGHPEDDEPGDRLWAVASDIASACDAHPDNLDAAVDALTDGDKATAYLWAALDLLHLAQCDSGEDSAIAEVAQRVAQLARVPR